MGTHAQRLLHDLPTLETFLRGEARVDSYYLMTSPLSLVLKNVEKRAPRGVQNALCQRMHLYHVENHYILNGNHPVLFRILLGRLVVEVPPLPRDLEMGLRGAASSLAAPVTPFPASGDSALLAP